MNSKYGPDFEITPPVKDQPLNKVFIKTDPAALNLVGKLLVYNPEKRCSVLDALTHEFFNELRVEGTTLKDGNPLPALFNFTEEELIKAEDEDIKRKLIPEWARQ